MPAAKPHLETMCLNCGAQASHRRSEELPPNALESPAEPAATGAPRPPGDAAG